MSPAQVTPRAKSLPALLLALAFGVLLSAPRAEDDGEDAGLEIVQFLASTGADADAQARARYEAEGDELEFEVKLQDVDLGDYELLVGGVVRGTIEVSAGDEGVEGELAFEAPEGDLVLDFEVLEQLVEVRREGTTYFSDTLTASGAAGGTGDDDQETELEVFLVNVGPDLDATGRLRYEAEPGEAEMELTLEGLDAGTYVLQIGGSPVSEIVSAGEDEVEVEFRDPVEDGALLLNFDPLGQVVELMQGETVLLMALLPASALDTGGKGASNGKKNAKDLGKGKDDALRVVLANSGVIAGAEGTAELEQSSDETEFQVKVEGLPAGDYDLLLDGALHGVMTVDEDGEGELEFSDEPEAENLLDFEVKGRFVEIQSLGETVLGVVFPISVQGALQQYAKEKHEADHVKVNLHNAGEDLDATGLANDKVKSDREVLKIKVRDLPAGTYHVLLDGVEQGTVTVTKDGGSAHVVFDSEAPEGGKKLPLDGPVLGALLEITDDEGTVVLRVEMV